MSDNKIVHLFVNINMAFSHAGLTEIAKKHRVNLGKLQVGEFALFANKALTAIKAFGANNTLIYYRAPENRPIDIRALKYLPQFISGMDIGYDEAILELFRKKYAHLYKEKRKKQGELAL